jgi:hypothetical protein
VIDSEWSIKLKPLVESDLNLRNVLLERGILNDAYHPEMEKIHLKNAKALMKLIDKKSFPVLSNAGEDGVRKSWLIIHNAISIPDFMKSSLLEMRLAAADKDYLLELLAYTEDRVAYFEGRKQLYGTNYDWQDGELMPTPIEDAERVNIRRKSIGLPPLGQVMPGNSKPPKNPELKAREFALWLRKVGWRL